METLLSERMVDVEYENLNPNDVTIADVFKLLIGIKRDLNQFHKNSEELENKVVSLEAENKNLKNRLVNLERKIKKNNILIYGLTTENTSVIETVINLINTKLNVKLCKNEINNCYQNKKLNSEPIFLELTSYIKKAEIFGNAYKLKNSGIGFTDDLCFEDRQERKQLVQHLKRAKNNDLKAHIKNNKLIINGEAFTLSDLSVTEKAEDSGAKENGIKVISGPLSKETQITDQNSTQSTSGNSNSETIQDKKYAVKKNAKTSAPTDRLTRKQIMHNMKNI